MSTIKIQLPTTIKKVPKIKKRMPTIKKRVPRFELGLILGIYF